MCHNSKKKWGDVMSVENLITALPHSGENTSFIMTFIFLLRVN